MKCAVIVVLDGVSHDVFWKLYSSGKLPFIEEISKEALMIKKCYSVFPSATVSGHASISTARHPGEHGLVGQAWFGRECGEYIGYDFELTMPDNWIDASTNLNDEHLLAKTGFEMAKELGLKTFSVDLVRKGADVKMSFIAPGEDKGVGVASKLMFLRRFARYRGQKRSSWIKKLILKLFPLHVLQHEIAVRNTLKAVRAGCRFGVTWFMETDAASHLFGPDSFEGEEGKLYIYDSAEDAIRDADEELEKLYKGSSRDYDPIIAIVTDHGQVRLKDGERHHVDLAEEFEREGINAFTNLDLHEYERRTGKTGEAVFAPSGPRMAHIYALRRHEDVFEALKSFESVEFIFFKQKGRIYLSDGDEIFPLNEYEFSSDYPRAKQRVEGLMKSERCGDFVITAKRGFEFEKADHKGAHGGLHFEESTGFGMIHKSGQKEVEIEEGEITEILPEVMKLLSV